MDAHGVAFIHAQIDGSPDVQHIPVDCSVGQAIVLARLAEAGTRRYPTALPSLSFEANRKRGRANAHRKHPSGTPPALQTWPGPRHVRKSEGRRGRRQTLSCASWMANCRLSISSADLNRRQKSPVVVGSGMDCVPSASKKFLRKLVLELTTATR